MIFYIGDLHFGHANVIFKYDNRPFASIEEHDEGLIRRWNAKVKKNDTVYLEGDISFYRDEAKTISLLKRLNGNIILIKGNHDRLTPGIRECFSNVYDYLEIKDGNRKVILCHYPIFFYNLMHHGAIMLYAHLHNSSEDELCKELIKIVKEKNFESSCRMFNVGCMNWNYEPVTLDEILSMEDAA